MMPPAAAKANVCSRSMKMHVNLNLAIPLSILMMQSAEP